MDTKGRIKDILRKYQPPLAPSQVDEIATKILEVTEPIEKERMITATRE